MHIWRRRAWTWRSCWRCTAASRMRSRRPTRTTGGRVCPFQGPRLMFLLSSLFSLLSCLSCLFSSSPLFLFSSSPLFSSFLYLFSSLLFLLSSLLLFSLLASLLSLHSSLFSLSILYSPPLSPAGLCWPLDVVTTYFSLLHHLPSALLAGEGVCADMRSGTLLTLPHHPLHLPSHFHPLLLSPPSALLSPKVCTAAS